MKTAGLTLALACLALVGASSAMASQFRAEQYEANIAGTLNGESETKQTLMSVGSTTLKCKSSSLSGALVSASSSLPLTPSYTKCTLFGVSATVSANSCQFVLNSTNESAPYVGTVGVTCSKGGDSIVIDAPSMPCKITIPPQAARSQVQYENVGLNRYRAIVAGFNSVTGLTHTATGVGCTKQGTFENGTMSGAYTLKANSGPEGTGLDGLYIANEQIAAGQAKLRAEKYPVTYGGSGKAQSTLGNVSNMQGSLEGSISGPAEDLSMAIGFTEGSYSLVKANGCKFVVHITGDESGTGGIACENPESKLVIERKGIWVPCTEELPVQSGLKGVTFKNVGTGSERAVEASISLSGIKFTSSGSACARQGTFTDGTLSFVYPVLLKAIGSANGIWLE